MLFIMRSRVSSYAITIVLPLSAALVLPGIRWCSLTWSELSAACVVRCVVAPAPPCATESCTDRTACAAGCPLAESGECDAPEQTAPSSDHEGRAFCFRDSPAEPPLQIASAATPHVLAARFSAPVDLEAPRSTPALRWLEPHARPPTSHWRTSPPVRGPPASFETT